MRINAVICEYNPFHNGHKYQLKKVKEKSNNPIAAIMSGNFTQRGDIAIADKFQRAEAAVKNGVDIVIELPAVYACSSAKNFAKAGVKTAEALGIVENLFFSVEEENADKLFKISEAFDNKDFNETIKRNMNDGMYYPKAVEEALADISPELSKTIKKPNNILAVEYLNALKNTDIKPLIIKRKFTDHDSDKTEKDFAGASNIRRMILENEDFIRYIPDKNLDFSSPADIKKLEKIIIYKLRSMSVEEIKNLPDVSEGLENRIYNSARVYNSLEEIISEIKTKRYTHARIRRILIYALLNITKADTETDAPYIRILAFNENGAKLLSEIKKNAKLPVIINVADDIKKLSGKAKRIFDIDLLSSDIYSLATDKINSSGSDFTRKIGITS